MARAPSPRAATSRCRGLSFPGGALIGCAAGFVNVPRIKGVHNAMGSGMLAAEHVAAALGAGRANDELVEYENAWRDSAVGKDLYRVRNVKPLWSKFGTIIGVALGGFDMWCNTLRLLAVRNAVARQARSQDAGSGEERMRRSRYPKPDGKLSFDKLSSVFLSNTNHEEDQPVHLKVADMNLQKTSEHDVYAGPSNRYCPAGVYEWVEEAAGSALPDQRPELRPLQNLRREGPERQYHLGSAGGRRRTQLRDEAM